jgi:ABC-type antimicrobial peptide transport system permease subunit
MDAMLDRALIRERLVAQLVGFFGAFGLLLASLGLYGLVSFGVTQRTREFGVRVAMGATVRDVLRLVLGQGFRLAVAGCALGVVAAVALTRVIASFLYGVSPADPLTLAAVASILLGVSLLACLVPARRAARIDASVAMRSE